MTISLEVLASATELLARPAPLPERAAELARALVPRAACGVVVDLVTDGGALERVVVEHRDPRMADVAARVKKLGAPKAEPRTGVQHLLRLRKPQLVATVEPADLLGAARSPEHAEALLATGIRSLVIVPLRALGRTLGILWLFGTADREVYTESDVPIAHAIGNALAIAIESAFFARTADEAICARDEFLSITSHELRTPLTSLALQIEVLRRGNLSSAKADEKLRSAARQVERLTRLAHDLLELPRVSGKFELQPVRMDLGAAARDVAAAMYEDVRRARCVLEVRAPSPVMGRWDLFRVEQVITNLLANALKYGRGAPIAIDVRQEAGRAVLTVEDHGIGIAPSDHARIFERFERAVPSREYGGLGLGLFIVRRVVEAQGGTVHVESERGKGARFVVQLPIATRARTRGTR